MLGGVVGRAVELDVLRAALDEVTSRGRSTVVTVHGEAGIGKSTLLAQFTGGLTAGHGAIAAVVVDRLDAAASIDDLETAVRNVGVAVVDGDSFGLVVVEDVHWCGRAELVRVRRAIDAVVDVPVLVVLSLRNAPISPALVTLLDELRDRDSRSVRLPALDPLELEELARQHLKRPLTPSERLALDRAGGNPLYAIELLRRGGAEGGPTPPLSALSDAIVDRIALLGERCRDALAVAAVIGGRFDVGDLAALLDEPVAAITGRLVDAVASGVLVDEGDRLAFRHPLVHEVVYELVPEAVRARLHREAAELARRRVPADRSLIGHAARAVLSTADDVQWIISVALEAAAQLGASAAPVVERALAHVGPDDPRRDDLTIVAITTRLLSGNASEAIATARTVLRRTLTLAQRDRAIAGLLVALQFAGDFDGVDELARSVRDAGEATATTRAEVGVRAAFTAFVAGDLSAAAVTAASTREDLARAGARPSLRSLLESTVALAHIGAGNVAGATEAVGAALDLDPTYALAHLAAGIIALEIGDASWADALERTLVLADGADASLVAVAFGVLALGSVATGDIEGAERHIDAARLAAAAHGEWVSETHFIDAVAADVALRRGDLLGARHAVARALDARDRTTRGIMHDLTELAHARVLFAEGDDRAAHSALRSAAAMGGPRRFFLNWRELVPELCRCRARPLQQIGRALLEEIDDGCLAFGVGGIAVSRWSHGLLDGDVDALLQAAGLAREAGRPLTAASIALDAARVLGRRSSRGRAAHDEAVAALLASGASHDERGRPVVVVAAAGRAIQQARPSSGWPSLTPAELAVVAQVVRGHTNPQIAENLHLSRYTVATHLKHVFAKLGVTSRTELAALAARTKRFWA